jgi:hypothetical protein
MTTHPPPATEGAPRRVVLIDFDWQDADSLPHVLRQGGIAVRLVAGERTEDAGVRLAEICGLPRTLDLADLTREIFDLALVSDRSPRRARVLSLLEALRTPCLSPRDFLANAAEKAAGGVPAARAPQRAGAGARAEAPPAPRATPSAEAARPGARAPEAAIPEPGAAAPDATASHAAPAPSGAESPPADRPSLLPPREQPAAAAAAAADALDATLERALEDLSTDVPADRRQAGPASGIGRALQSLANFPSTEDRAALEEALRQLVANTGAVGAELHAGRASAMKLVAQVGTTDPLLGSMIGLAAQHNVPQILKGLSSPHEGKLWGAWPFRTIQHRAVLAASAIDPSAGVSPWEKMLDEVKERWDRQDRESAVRSFPLLPEQERAWLTPPEFRARLLLAVERNKFDGLSFTTHRLEFPGPEVAYLRMCEGLPHLLRGSDYLCRVPPRHVLLLTAVSAEDYPHVRRRLLAAWEQAWRDSAQAAPAPPIADLRAEIAGPEDADGFLASAESWLKGAESADAGPAAAADAGGARPDDGPAGPAAGGAPHS